MNLKKIYYLLGLVILFSGCVHTKIKVVDENGKPVVGALVISERPMYIMQPWELSAYFTNTDGEAEIASDYGYIFSKSHHLLINKYLSKITKIYTVGRPKTKAVTKKLIKIVDMLEDRKIHNIPVEYCPDVNLLFHPQNGEFIAQSKNKSLIKSKSFYFETGDIKDINHEVKSSYGKLTFYCKNIRNFSKITAKMTGMYPIGIGVRGATMEIEIKEINNITLDTYIESGVIPTITKNDFYIRELHPNKKPSVSASKNLKEKLKGFNEQLDEGNEHTQALFDYVIKAVELSK